MQTAMVLTCQKPTQPDRVPKGSNRLRHNGEVREGLPGSTLERGMRVEKRPGTWEVLPPPVLFDVATDALHGMRLVSPTNGEILKQGRPKPKRCTPRGRSTQQVGPLEAKPEHRWTAGSQISS